MTSISELIDALVADGVTTDILFENIKGRMCDDYCKYPLQYKVKDSDLNYDKLISEVCKSCPMNIL